MLFELSFYLDTIQCSRALFKFQIKDSTRLLEAISWGQAQHAIRIRIGKKRERHAYSKLPQSPKYPAASLT